MEIRKGERMNNLDEAREKLEEATKRHAKARKKLLAAKEIETAAAAEMNAAMSVLQELLQQRGTP